MPRQLKGQPPGRMVKDHEDIVIIAQERQFGKKKFRRFLWQSVISSGATAPAYSSARSRPGEERGNQEWFDWHHRLTGSCEFGRRAFVADRGLDLEGSSTPEQFFSLTRDAFAPEVMKQAEAAWKEYWKI